MRVQMDEVARGVEAARALAWWTDFQEGRHDHAFLPGATRRVVRRDATSAEVEEEGRLLGLRVFRERWTGRVEQGGFSFEGENTFSRFRGAYRFEPVPGGTRIRLEATLRLRGPLRLVDLLAAPLARMALRHDLRGHVHDLERDLG